MTSAMLDVAAVRAAYPALADGWAYLDGAAGTQVPEAVIAAESAAYRAGIGNHGGLFAASRRSAAHTAAAREAVVDLLGAPGPAGVALGPSTTALTFRFAGALAKTWREGDEIVLTRLDHDANVRPWVLAAERTGVTVRWADPVLPGLDLPTEVVTGLLTERTRLVAVTAASNVVGTRPDVRAIADAAHAATNRRARVYVDGVHATPHGPVDLATLGADLFATSSYKWSGPHLAAVVGAPDLLAELHPDKLDPVADVAPDRFERGTSPFAQHAGLAAAVDHLAALVPGEGTRRERIVASMAVVEAHEAALLARLLTGIAAMDHVERIGAPSRQAPALWFTVRGMTPDAVAQACADAQVNVWSGHNYAWELAGFLGIRDSGSAVRAGMSCYTSDEDVDRLLAVLATLG
ncbi:MAG: cysteine desulfurase-like protein [Kineosporiaceae bacterium]